MPRRRHEKYDKSKQRYSVFANTFFALAWCFKISPGYTLYRLFNTVIGDVITLFEHTFLPAHIITCVEEGRPLVDALRFIIPICILVAIKVIQGPIVNSYITPKFNKRFKAAVNLTLYKKAAGMDIERYDNTEFYNDFVWAMDNAPQHINDVVGNACSLVSTIVTAVISGGYIVAADPISLIAAVIILPVCFLAYRTMNKLYISREEETVPIVRRRDYIKRVFYLAEFQKDLKTGDIAEKFKKDYKQNTTEMFEPINKYSGKIILMSSINNVFTTVVWDGLFLTYLFWRSLVKGKYGFGTLLGIYNSGDRLIGNLRRITRIYPDFQRHSMYIDKLRIFLDTKNTMPDNGKLDVPKIGDITIKDLVFTYKGNAKPTLNGINLNIKKGEKIALVGFNGAGKTTLIKLMLRLYDADSGSIGFGENSITEYPLTDYRKRFAVLFQDFTLIAATLADNINMGEDDFDEKRATEAFDKVDFKEKFNTLPDGFDTVLTKEFSPDGVEFSGGEAQKIALSRVLYSNADVLILDEPSAALDPIAEYRLNKAIIELSGNKTVIIISHRLSTTRFVDKIYMLEDGKVIEEGNHQSLMERCGKYCDMFQKQAEKYMDV